MKYSRTSGSFTLYTPTESVAKDWAKGPIHVLHSLQDYAESVWKEWPLDILEEYGPARFWAVNSPRQSADGTWRVTVDRLEAF